MSVLSSNPVFRKMKTIEATSDRTATMKGIASKTIYFLLLAVLGAVGFTAMHELMIAKFATMVVPYKGVLNIVTTIPELGIVAAAMLATALLPLFAWFFRKSIPVVGSLYAISEGITIGFLTNSLASGYQWIVVAALAITALIIVLMMFLYRFKIVKVGGKFRTIVTTSFLAMIALSAVFMVMAFIPFTRPVILFVGTPVIYFGFSALSVIVAALFLVSDFETIQMCIDKQLGKEYEWMAAWGFAYSIIYIFVRVFTIILELQQKK